MNKFLIIASIGIFYLSCNQPIEDKHTPSTYNFKEDSIAISNVLIQQQNAWNNGNIEGFMQGYWNDEKLTFISGNGVTYGWQNTLSNYQKGYPDKEAMGTLQFDIIQLHSLGRNSAQVIGKYSLTRTKDQPMGHFSLIFQRIDDQWKLTSDMTANVSNPK